MGTTPSDAELEKRLQELIEEHGIPGAQLTVLDGDSFVEAAAGVLNLSTAQPATPESLFLPGSIGKLYTATVLMMLVDDGAVDPGAPVQRYLPDLATADLDALRSVTVKDLLSHTSGFDGDHFEDTGRGDDAVARYLAGCASLAQLCPPGKLWSYCNAGYAMLGRVIEVLAGTTYEDALRARLIEPLGLTHTVLFPEQALVFGVAAGHITDPADPTKRIVSPQWGMPRSCGPMGASLIASATDVLRFVRLHLDAGVASDGTRLLQEATVRAMQAPQIELVDPTMLGEAWGLGWILDDWGGARVIGHDGNSLGQNAFMRVAPDERFGFCLQTNVESALAMYRAVATWLFSERLGVEPRPWPEPAPELSVDAARFAGTYEREGLTVEVAAGNGSLVMTFRPTGLGAVGAPPMENLAAAPVDDRTFLVELPIADGAIPVVFFNPDDGGGTPTYMHFGGRAAARRVL